MTSLPPAQLLSIAGAFRPTPCSSGGLWFASDMAGVSQTYRIDGPDRFPVRLAPSQDRTLPIAETPLGLLVRQDQGGNETWQLALLEAGGGLRPVTADGRAIHRDVHLSPDGLRAGLAFNPGGQSDWVLGVIDLGSGEIERLVDRGGSWSWLGWSPDGRTAAVSQDVPVRPNHNRAYLLGEGGELRPILSQALLVADVLWAGDRLLALTDLDREFIGLVELDPTSPDGSSAVLRRLVDEEHDVLAVVPDPAGRRVAVVVNEGAHDAVRVLDLVTGQDVTATLQPAEAALPPGVVHVDNSSRTADHVRWSPDGASLFVAWESPTSPAEIHELPSGARWTRAGGDTLGGLATPAQVSYRSFDGLQVPALHYRVDGAPRPTVVLFHGGPTSQARASFQPAIAMWNAAGFDVLAPNVRGSSGYGRRYYSLDDRELRWDSVRDGCEAGRWLRSEGHATRLIAMGASYGGFMTLAVLVEDPGLWDAGVDIVGIGDWHSFFANTSGWRRANRAAEYGDPTGPDGEFLAEFSPLRRAHRIQAPLLVIHGRNDVRVPVSEAVQVHDAARDSELLIFDDEGHGILRHGNRTRAYGRALDFVRQRING
ncbi:MAG TPA: prolyl oligopeptidase family serine peptidase [Candidatus Dormibacteraeota bacterium]|jgi:dienelactone hydrolase